MILYSTVDRKRGTTELWLVGNTISRVCPYINAWGLEDIFRTIKQGEIKTKIIKNETNDVKIAIEYCKSSGGLQMTIGNASKMVDSGSWQSQPQPLLPGSKKDYTIIYRVAFYYKHFTFIGELLKNKNNEYCWFIFPKYDKIKEKTIVFSDKVNISPYWQKDIYNIAIKNEKLKKLFIDTFRESMIFYSSDLCGTDFKECIDFTIRK